MNQAAVQFLVEDLYWITGFLAVSTLINFYAAAKLFAITFGDKNGL